MLYQLVWTLFALDTFEVVALIGVVSFLIFHHLGVERIKKDVDHVTKVVAEMQKQVISQYKTYNETIDYLREDNRRLIKEVSKLQRLKIKS